MRRNPLKWLVLGGAMTVIIMYGIDVSSSGVERIYGPLDQANEYVESEQLSSSANDDTEFELAQRQKISQLEKELQELKRLAGLTEGSTGSDAANSLSPENLEDEGLSAENERLPGVPLEIEQPAVNRIADSTSGLLQSMSSEGIRFVVSIFDGLTN